MGVAPQTENELILLRTDVGGVATLTLNRPSQFNSLSMEVLTELQSALDAIAQDISVRAVVMAGAGKAFCAGHDLKQMRANHTQNLGPAHLAITGRSRGWTGLGVPWVRGGLSLP